jgi:hypothetical protein
MCHFYLTNIHVHSKSGTIGLAPGFNVFAWKKYMLLLQPLQICHSGTIVLAPDMNFFEKCFRKQLTFFIKITNRLHKSFTMPGMWLVESSYNFCNEIFMWYGSLDSPWQVKVSVKLVLLLLLLANHEVRLCTVAAFWRVPALRGLWPTPHPTHTQREKHLTPTRT